MTADYEQNDQLGHWNSNPTQHVSGDLTNDTLGNTYTWNERDQLSTVATTNSSTVGEFYDAFGRRYQRCSGPSCTQNTFFVYDGLNPAQEIPGTTILTGLGLDEYLSRTHRAQ